MHEALVLQWRVLRPNATCALSRPHGTRRFRPSRADSPGWRRQSAGRNWPAGSAPAKRRLCDRKGDLRLGAREWARCAVCGHSPDIVDSGSVRAKPTTAVRGPRISYVSRGLLGRLPARRGSGELKVDRHADPALPVDLRAGNARLGVGRFDRDAMLDVDTVHWHCPSLSRVQPFGLPRNDGT